jgi:hypothetical protein
VVEARHARALLIPILAAFGIVVMLLAVIRVLIVVAIFGAPFTQTLLLAVEVLHLDHGVLHQSLKAQGKSSRLDRHGRALAGICG